MITQINRINQIPQKNALLLCLLSLITVNTAHSAGFQSYEFGTPTLGRAAVGQSVVEDASIAYLNPAGMSLLESSEMMLGSELIITKNRFRPNQLNTMRGNDGGNAGMIFPGVNVFSVFDYSPDVKFGLSLASPFAGTLDYNNGWVGRFFVQSTTLITLDVNPSFSYALNEYLSFGAGFIVQYAKLNQTIGIPPIPRIRLGDGQADLRLEQYRPGYNLGLLFTPNCTTNIGISYRSRMNHRLKGNTTYLNLDSEPTSTATLKLPQGAILSVSHDIFPSLKVLAEIGWTNWKYFKNTIITIQNITLDVPRKWRDTYRIGAGFQQTLNEEFILQFGSSFDSSPTKKTTRLPDLPMDKQWRIGTGLIYSPCEPISVSLSYEYLRLGKARIHKETPLGTLSGHYPKNFAHFFGLSINIQL